MTRRRVLIALVTFLGAGVALLAGVAIAAWLVNDDGNARGAAKADTMAAGNAPSGATVGSTNDVVVTWAASTLLNTGAPATSYTVQRYQAFTHTAQTVGASCSGSIAVLTCTETDVPGGTWVYTVTPRRTLWSGAESADSAPVAVDSVAPVVTLATPANGASTNDNTPTFAGTAGNTPGDNLTVTVDVYAGTDTTGSLVQTRNATRTGGTWTIDASPALANGTYTARATQGDAAGNTGTSNANTFTVDTTAPAVVITVPVAPAYRPATFTASGTAGDAAGDSATVLVELLTSPGMVVVESDTVVRTGTNWSTTIGPISPDNLYTLRVTQTDTAGNTGTATRSVTVDTVAPVPAIQFPTAGAHTNDNTPTLSGIAGFNTSDNFSVLLTVYAGSDTSGTVVQTHTIPANLSWSTSASPALADGTYTYTATQSDLAGNTGTSAPRTFVVDTTAPSVAITTPTAGFVNDATPTIAGTAGNGVGDFNTINITIYNGTGTGGTVAKAFVTARTGTSWSVSTPAPNLPDGPYTVQATQVDQAGNTGTSNAVSFTVDATVPVVTLTAPVSNAIVTTGTPVVGGTAGNASGDASVIDITVWAGSGTGGSIVKSFSVSRSATLFSGNVPAPALADGVYTARASQSDTAGNVGVSAANVFTVDTITPTVVITSPANNGSTSDTTPAISGTAGNATGDSTTIGITIFNGTGTGGSIAKAFNATKTAGATTWSADTPTPVLAQGTYTVRATQSDLAGHLGTSAANTFTVDTTAPVPDVDVPANNARTGDSTPTLSGTAGNATNDNTIVDVEIFSGSGTGGTLLHTLNVTRSGTSWSTSAPVLADGTYTARARQGDLAGNVGGADTNVFTVDATAPVVTVTTPAANASTPDQTPAVAGTAGTLTGDSTSVVTVKIYSGTLPTGSPVKNFPVDPGGSSWSGNVATPNLAQGTYTIQAEQADDVGNVGLSNANTFTVDTTGPSGVAVTAGITPTNDTTPTLTGTAGNAANDNATVTVEIFNGTGTGGTIAQTLTPTRTGTAWTATPTTLANGTYTARARQSDLAGNQTIGATTWTFVIDTVAPFPNNVALANGGTAGEIGPNDTVTVTFSERLKASSICSAWASDTTNQTINADSVVTVTVTNSGNNDLLTVSVAGGTCPTFNFGTVALGANYVSTTRTFSGSGTNGRSEVRWNPTSFQLTIEIGTASGSVNTGVSQTSTPDFTPSSSLLDLAGNAAIPEP